MATSPDARLAARSRRRHGIVTPADAQAVGMSRATFYRRVAEGAYAPVHGGRAVFRAVGHPATPLGDLLAAVLAVGGEAVACRGTALAAWQVADRQMSRPFHVALPQRSKLSLDGIVVHECSTLGSGDRTILGGVPVTRLGRSVVDAAGALTPEELEDVVLDAQRRRPGTLDEVNEILARVPTAAGSRQLRRIMRRFDPEAAAALMSRLEVGALRLAVGQGLPQPEVNRRLYGPDGALLAQVDLRFPPAVTTEWDGLRWHATRRQKEHDDARQNELILSGEIVLRYSLRDLEEPERVAREIRRAIEIARGVRRQEPAGASQI